VAATRSIGTLFSGLGAAAGSGSRGGSPAGTSLEMLGEDGAIPSIVLCRETFVAPWAPVAVGACTASAET
jgi:hypothetical protein